MKQPFRIHVEQSVLDDLKKRLAATRWPGEIENTQWEYGTNQAYLKDLCHYWQHEYDWRSTEEFLNGFRHFKTGIEGTGIHFIHEKGKGIHSAPLLLTHGWPDSFFRFVKVVSLLTEPDDTGFSFDVVIPSIPGYGFSDQPTAPGMTPEKIAQLFARLMQELGYEKYLAHGGDWGSSITEQLMHQHPAQLYGIHLTDVPHRHIFAVPQEQLSEPEKKYLEKGKQWQMTEGAYAMIQGTKPQSLSYGLNDSPAGLAGWIIEKFKTWSDNGGNVEEAFTKDEMLTNLTIYWATQTINSANRIYCETTRQPYKPQEKKSVPTAVAIFPHDLIPAPREFGERIFTIHQWTNMPRGGHFAALEEPELLSADIRKFAKSLRIA